MMHDPHYRKDNVENSMPTNTTWYTSYEIIASCNIDTNGELTIDYQEKLGKEKRVCYKVKWFKAQEYWC